MSETQSTYNYKVVRQFTVMTVIWGIVGMLVGVIIAAQLVWPELNLRALLHLRPSAAIAYQCGDLRLWWQRACSLPPTTWSSAPAIRGSFADLAGGLHLLGLATDHRAGRDHAAAWVSPPARSTPNWSGRSTS
jgi:hypothetical protein